MDLLGGPIVGGCGGWYRAYMRILSGLSKSSKSKLELGPMTHDLALRA